MNRVKPRDTLSQSSAKSIDETAGEIERQIGLLQAGQATRTSVAKWAADRLKSVSDVEFRASAKGELVEYILARLLDDDGSPDGEFQAELSDLLRRLEVTRQGSIELP